jgi:hypothetical protein
MKKALVLSLAVVLGLGVASFAQTLSGSWITEITIDPQGPVYFTAFDSEIAVEYAISGWAFSSLTVLDLGGWIGQQFGFSGALGAFTMGGTLDFTPIPGVFNYLLVDGGVSLAGVNFGLTWLLENREDDELVLGGGDLGVELTASGTAGAVTIDVAIAFGDIDVVPYLVDELDGFWEGYDHVGNDICDLNWNGFAIDVTFPFCCADITGALAFDCNGFASACFSVYNILIPNLPFLDIDAKVCFERVAGTQTGSYVYDKNFYLKPGLTLGTIACFDLYTYLGWNRGDDGVWGPVDDYITVESIRFRGIGLSCEIGGVTFTGLTWLQATTLPEYKPGILYMSDYYEAYQIATTDDGCCGPFSFDVTFFFDKAGLALFDVAQIVANVSYELGSNFIFTTGLTVDTGVPGFSEWMVGFEVTW